MLSCYYPERNREGLSSEEGWEAKEWFWLAASFPGNAMVLDPSPRLRPGRQRDVFMKSTKTTRISRPADMLAIPALRTARLDRDQSRSCQRRSFGFY